MPDGYDEIAMIDRLAGGDVLKYDQVYEMNYLLCLNALSYWFIRDEYQEAVNNHTRK